MAGAVLPISGSLAQALSATSPYAGKIGLQLWTVRNQMSENEATTLKAVKDAGYHQVELMEAVGAEALVKQAKDLGLGVTSSFFGWEALKAGSDSDVVKKTIAAAKGHGLSHLVYGYIGRGHRETTAHYQKAAAFLNQVGRQCKEAGIQLSYHNHSFEFEPLNDNAKKCGFDVLMAEMDHEMAKFELDVFWVELGGWNALDTVNQLGKRIAQLHLKDKLKGTATIFDEGKVPEKAFKELGQGTIAMGPILEAAAKHGVANCHVEQDQSPDPIKSIGTSMRHLKELS